MLPERCEGAADQRPSNVQHVPTTHIERPSSRESSFGEPSLSACEAASRNLVERCAWLNLTVIRTYTVSSVRHKVFPGFEVGFDVTPVLKRGAEDPSRHAPASVLRALAKAPCEAGRMVRQDSLRDPL